MNRDFKVGFTLLELLLVIVVISMLLGILLPAFAKIREVARERKRDSDLKTLPLAVKNYFCEFGEWPVPDTGGIDPDVPLEFVNDNNEVATILSTERDGQTFIQLGDYTLDDTGNITDPWKSPYKFIFKTDSDNFDRIGFFIEQQ